MNTENSKRIGVLVSCLHEHNQAKIWEGLTLWAAPHQFELIAFVGTSQDNVDTLENHYFVAADFIDRCKLDGIICFGGAIENHRGKQFAESLYRRFSNLPAVVISSDSDNLPGVLVENFSGVVSLVEHLTSVHRRRRIAFIKGPDGAIEAEERFSAYRHGLEKEGLAFDPALVQPGHFSRQDGYEGIAALLREGISFDAVIGADDLTALGAIDCLQKAGIKVPGDVSVCGFDDAELAAASFPQLTTVRQPCLDLARTAIEILERQLDGKDVSSETLLSTTMICRRSCGCPPAAAQTVPVSPHATHVTLTDITTQAQTKIESLPTASKRQPMTDPATDLIAPLIDNYIAATTDTTRQEAFVHRIEQMFDHFPADNDFLEMLQQLLCQLYLYVEHSFSDIAHVGRASRLTQQGIALIKDYRSIALHANRLDEAAFNDKVRECCMRIITTFDRHQLMTLMASKFPTLNIPAGMVALYDKKDTFLTERNWTFPETSTLLLSFNTATQLRTIMPEGSRHPTHRIIPENNVDTKRITNWIVMPVFFGAEHFGFMTIQHHPTHPPFMYEEIRTHLGSSIKSASLMDELKIQSMMDELTGVQNRRGFLSRGRTVFESARANNVKTLVFYIDLDKLKTINDTWGHEEGDLAISSAATILKRTFRRNDVIGRIGGDEFCVILAADNANESGDAILKRLHEQQLILNKEIEKPYRVTMTVGTNICHPADDLTLDDVLKIADTRMLNKKKRR